MQNMAKLWNDFIVCIFCYQEDMTKYKYNLFSIYLLFIYITITLIDKTNKIFIFHKTLNIILFYNLRILNNYNSFLITSMRWNWYEDISMSDDLSLLNIIICDSKIQNKKFVFKQIFFKK